MARRGTTTAIFDDTKKIEGRALAIERRPKLSCLAKLPCVFRRSRRRLKGVKRFHNASFESAWRRARSARFNVSRTVEGATPRRLAISRVATAAENFNRIISRAWRIATRSAGIDHSLGLPKARPKQASGDRHRRTSYPGRDYLVTVGGFIS
jgi:hypothetical protein